MAQPEVAYLGPVGTYSHLMAEKRFGKKANMVPMPTIHDVCSFVAKGAGKRGIVPIENSSGGAIYETVDILLANKPKVHIDEELRLEVNLALLGRKGEKIQTLYSHFAPLEHCASWVKKNLPGAKRQVVTSTAEAALRASIEQNAASLGSRRLASIYKLNVLVYPVQAEIPNITTFLAISAKRNTPPRANKTTLAVKLPNEPGALCNFLEKFRDHDINLSRLISRPIRGCPKEYAFLVDMEGKPSLPNIKRGLAAARATCVEMRIAGTFPSHRRYKS
jgi:chorismate mutase/prephenate dehydratase